MGGCHKCRRKVAFINCEGDGATGMGGDGGGWGKRGSTRKGGTTMMTMTMNMMPLSFTLPLLLAILKTTGYAKKINRY